jgi:hypothetical protein
MADQNGNPEEPVKFGLSGKNAQIDQPITV